MSKIISYYDQFDEWGRLDREPIEFQVNWHYIKKYLPKIGHVLDNGAGPGKYSMRLAKEGYRVTLTDLTPRLVEIAKNKAEELGLEAQFEGLYSVNARELKMLDAEQFDASLMLGPMYHLQEEKDRIKAVQELYRVTKQNGFVFVAFMPRIRHILTSLLSPENWKPNNNMDTIVQFSQSGCFNHADEGRFTGAYYFNIEDINPFMEAQGFENIQLIGSNVGTILNGDSWNYWKDQGERELQKVIDLIIEKGTDPYILGISSHLLYIGRKK
ncbi:bifunctional 2-polyprenyl-6-hydroxyphenol methylase/3-demethylubiquinol 3-O-methyltransferase UbiG [Psychrobacillus sp. OK032]|uniref:class I SAM-dependent methyltransferase n=1 Tax=Psychrobacillus sp. OK032 TaxID=1884358 RepID=UPI0008BE6C11|nr:class I SAM-dependent methyltransferase [Psychrobacillus sp. OK032]SER79161.1 Methyltransferase domain-containing protein [Psychrobacillus sp. OK032]